MAPKPIFLPWSGGQQKALGERSLLAVEQQSLHASAMRHTRGHSSFIQQAPPPGVQPVPTKAMGSTLRGSCVVLDGSSVLVCRVIVTAQGSIGCMFCLLGSTVVVHALISSPSCRLVQLVR